MLQDEDHQEWARSAVTSSDRSVLQLIGVLHFWTVEVHICMVVLDSPGCGERGEPTGRTATGSRVIRDVLMVSKVQTRIEVELELNRKTRNDSKVEMGRWGPSVRVRSGEEKYVS